MRGVIGTSMMLLLRDPGKALVYDHEGKAVSEEKLPALFGLPVRKDLIKRAFLSEFTARLQPKGRDPMAGKRTSARSFGVGLGIARVPRIPGLGRAAFVNSAVGGHLAHPPRPEKRIHERINRKEKLLATASALAATSIKEMVKARGHLFEADTLPVLITAEAEHNIATARDARLFLEKIGLWSDIVRAKERTRTRAGKGKRRGRRYITPRSILFILQDHQSPLARAVRNFPGVSIAEPQLVSVLDLAPGAVPGRLTVISLPALKKLEQRFRPLATP